MCYTKRRQRPNEVWIKYCKGIGAVLRNRNIQERGRELAKLQVVKDKREVNTKSGESREDYKSKIRRYKMAAIYRFGAVFLVLGILAVIIYVQYKNHIYTDYDYLSAISINRVSGTESIRLDDHILTYGNDGAHCTNMEGLEIWNQTYEMQKPIVSVCDDKVAIGDYNGREVYVLDTEKKLCQINTTMPIRNIAVSADGRVAVAVTDTEITWIYVYEADGTAAYEIKTTMSQSGYPIDFSFSPNGTLLGMSCIFVDAGVVTSKVAFYNFGPVGSGKTDFFVGAHNYPDVIIPYIRFLSDGSAVAVGDDRLIFYSGSQVPTPLTQYLFEDEIQGVYQNGEYLGLVFRSDVLEMQNKVEVYKSDSKKMGTFYFDTALEDIIFTKDYFVAYGGTECVIKTYDNVEKFAGHFDRTIDLLIPAGSGAGYKFALVSGDGINTIQLK